MADSDGGNLKIQQEINKVLSARTALLASNQKMLSGQVQTAIQLCKALKCEELDKIAEQMAGIDNATAKAAKAAEDFGKKSAAASAAAIAGTKAEEEALKKRNAQINVAKAAALGAFGGMMSGISSSISMLKGLGKGLLGIVGTLGKVGKTILSIPFKIMGGLIGMSQGGGGGPSPIRLELEAIRKVYGSLASNEGKALASVQGQVQKASQNLAGTGLKMAKVFGYGPKGVAEAMKQAGEIAKALGPSFNSLTKEFEKNAVQLTMLTRGFTGSADATAAMMKHAKALGKDGTKYITDIAGMAQTMGEKFGVSAKVIGKGMGEMMKNISDFGHMAKKEMLAATTYAAKLGLEIKDLGGVMNKFLNFEDAADGAAQMAQAFGMNVDAMELMKGGPEAIDEMRRAFFESGKSLEDMSAAERKMLETQTGLTGAAMESAFSAESQGTQYKDMKKGAADSEKQAKSQTEVMNKLADSIDRVFGGGGGQKFKGFFDAFIQGFSSGIQKTKEFRQLMKNLRKSLKVVYKGGKDVGKMFVDMFPGVKDMIKGMADLFDPNRMKKLMDNVKKVFKSFFKDLETNPETAVEKFFERMTKAFKKWFSGSGPAAAQMKKGGGKFLKALGAIFKGLLTMALKGLTKLFTNIAEAIKNPPEVKSALGTAFAEFGKSIFELLKLLGPPLMEAFGSMIMAAFEKLKGSPHVQKAMAILKKVILTKIFMAAALGAAKAAAGAILTNVIGPMLKKMVMGSKQLPKKPTGGPADPEELKKIQKGGRVLEGDKTDWKKAMAKAALVVVFIAVSIVALAGAFYVAAQIIKKISIEDIFKTAAFMMATGMMMMMAAAAVRMNKGVNTQDVIKELAALVLVIPAIGAVGMVLGPMIANTTLPSAGETLNWGLMMAAGITAAGACIWAAGKVTDIVKKSGGYVKVGIGLLLLGGVMLGLGWIGQKIGQMLGKVPNPGGVAKLMTGLSAIMLTVMLMLPIAGLLGLMLVSWPFGTAGIGILLLGFGVLGTLAGAMVGSLMPAIKTIAGLKISNPEHFKMVTEAIVAIINGISSFTVAVARIMEAIDPGIAASIDGSASEEMRKSMKAVESLINTIMVPMQAIINQMVELATSADIEKEGVDAIKAISSVIQAIANLMKAFSPSDAAFEAMNKAQGFFNPNGAKKLMASIAKGQKMVMDAAVPMIEQVGVLITNLANAVKGGDFEGAKPLVDVLPKILNAIAGLMKALAPSEGAMKAVQEAAGSWTSSSTTLVLAMGKQMQMAIGALKDVLPVIGEEMGKLISTHLKDTIMAVNAMDVDPQVISAVGDMVAGLLTALGAMLSGVGPAMASMQEALETNYFYGPSKQEQMKSMMGDFATMMEALGGVFDGMTISIKKFIEAIVPLLDQMGDPERAGAQMEVVTQMVAALGSTIEPLQKAMKLIEDSPWRLDAKSVYWFFGEPGKQGTTGLLAVLVTSVGKNIANFVGMMKPVMAQIGNPEKAAAQLGVLATAVKLLGEVTGPLIKTMDMIGKYKAEGTSWNSEVYWFFGEPGKQDSTGLLAVIVTSVGMSIANFMKQMTKIMSDIKDPAAAGKKMELIALSVQSMGTMLELLGKAMKMIVKHKDASWQAEVNFYFGIPDGLMYRMALSMGTSIGTIVKLLTQSVANIEDPKKTLEAAKMIGLSLEAVGTFAEVVQGFMKMKIGRGLTNSEKLNGIMEMIGGISVQLAYSMPQVVTGLLAVIKGSGQGLSDLYKYRHSIKILGELMCTVGLFADAISSLSNLGGSGRFKKSKVERILKDVGDLFGNKGKGEAVQALKKIIEGITQIPAATGKINLKTMEKTSKFVVVFLKVVDDMQKVGSNQNMYDMFRNSAKMLTGPTGYIQTMTDIMTALQGLPAGAGKINLVTMKKIGEFIECGMLPAVQHIGNIPTVISDKVSQVSEAMTMFTNLSETISGKSFATAVKIGESLSGKGEVKLTHENINVNVQINVDMAAEQLARGIVKTKEMKSAMGQGG